MTNYYLYYCDTNGCLYVSRIVDGILYWTHNINNKLALNRVEADKIARTHGIQVGMFLRKIGGE